MMVHFITFLLLVVGGLNWLLVGALGWDVGQLFGGQDAIISRIIYILVGISALYELVMHKKNCKMCGMGGHMKSDMMKDKMPSQGGPMSPPAGS